MLEAAVAEARGPAPTHPGSREQRSLRPPTKIPSGQHGLWGHNAASRPPPLPRRRVALPRTAWCGALSAGRSSGSRIMAVSGLPKRPASTKRAAQWHPLDPGDGGAVFIDVDLGRGRGGHNRKRRGQDASSRQQGRLIRQAQELAADDLPRLPAINDPFDEDGALRVDEPIIE